MNLRRLGLVSIAVLLAQLLLGVAASLWVTIGTPRPWSQISDAALFAAHGLLGVVLLLLTFVILTRAFEDSPRRDKVAAVVSFVGVLGALGCGVGFVSSGGVSGYSFGMAIGWVVVVSADLCLVLTGTGASRPEAAIRE